MKALIPEEEENLIVDYIYITFLIPILEQDQHAPGFLQFKIQEVYQDFIENKSKELRRELVSIKARMKELKIKWGTIRDKWGLWGALTSLTNIMGGCGSGMRP